MNLRMKHVKCGGEIYVPDRKCIKCGKRWNPVSFQITNEIRPMTDSSGKVMVTTNKEHLGIKVERKPTSYVKWMDNLGPAGTIASRLPNWPRWARLLVGTTVIGGVVILVLWLTGKL